ncbi:LuxR family transcriptional regulator [Conyzicola nivalis]|uniref:LuxR family transcriptional regulator n=1 Tax=Conyzicola nivalis TaxID=1477021 RepID=A0A916WK92_9MICO|nr:AAA family ATPase [Conyzicola nivalis]GGB05986.1 LuxR family transcriptional regulator [Conyzicola nivalis]
MYDSGQNPMGVAPERRELLARAVTAGKTPGGRLMLVGEPGMGKSYLIDAVLRSLDGARQVLFTRTTAGDHEPFAGLRDLLARIPDEAFQQLPSEQRDPVLAVLGRGPSVHSDPATLQAGVTQILSDISRGGAAIVVDEWQWLDPETRRLVERALLRPEIGSALSIVAARSADGSPEDLAVRPLFASTDVAAVVELRAASVRRVVADAGFGKLSPSTMADVTEVSGGNPLWAMELASARANGDPRRSPSISVVEAMRDRVAALPTSVRDALALVAVLGSIGVDDLEALRTNAVTAVAVGVERRVFRFEDGVVSAAHPLLAAAALNALTPDEERALNAAVSVLPLSAFRQLEHRNAGAQPGVHEGLALELSTATARARCSGATETAFRLARKALVRTGQDSTHRPSRVADAAELAFAIGDAALALEIVAELDLVVLSVPVFDRSLSVLVLALDKTGGQTAVVRRLESLQRAAPIATPHWNIIETWRVISSHGQDDDAVRRLLELVDVLPGTETPRTVSAALQWAAYFRLERGEGVDDALVAGVRAVERVAGAPALEDTADAMEALWPHQADDLVRSRANLTTFIRAAKAAGESYATVQGLAHATIVETIAGRLDAAQPLLLQTEEEARALQLLPPSVYRARALIALARNDRELLDELLLGRMSPAAENHGSLLRAGVAGLDNAYSERWDDALEDLEVAYSAARSRHIDEPGKRLWIDVELVRALVHIGDVDRATAITADLAVLGQRPMRAHARGQALRLQALLAARLGDDERALRLSSDGLAALRRGGFQPELVRAQLEQIELLRSMGQVARGRHLLSTVTESAARIGDPRLIGRAESARARLESDDGRATLTPAELRVARAAASGQTNREIAAELFLSIRTVETHLASGYRKIGVRTRTQLALSLHDLTLEASA